MPNLNLKGDEPDDISDLSDFHDSDLPPSGSGGSGKRLIPLIAGPVIALLLALFILNKIGIVHLWGPKKASSSMTVITAPADTASQVLSDSAMIAQFKKDSLQAVADARASSRKKPAAKTPAAQTETRPAITAMEKKAPAKAAPAPPKPVAQTPAAVKSAAPVEKNMTRVEVPGAGSKQTAQAETESKPVVHAASRTAPVSHAVKKPRTTGAQSPSKIVSDTGTPVEGTASAKPSESPAPTGEGQFTVQISSWMSKAKAQAFADRFTKAGIPAFIYTEGHVHRVCTGHFATREAATERAESLVPMLESKYDIIVVK